MVVDARPAFWGGASIVVKKLLYGLKVAVVRCEEIFYGMIPHKIKRGAAALAGLKAYEEIHAPYDKINRMVIPNALKVLRFQKGHKYGLLDHLSSEVRWNHYNSIRKLIFFAVHYGVKAE
ncbi:hypothetical protein V6N13_135979 [Hibiscus sabdariffa]|uniref:Uncharacterized protein n=1 Tax=Hibiscus sabdariffa TaxID=183260 RepID=A0ABR2QT84_9ROSI